MKDKELDEFIRDLNENVKFTTKSDMILRIKKCSNYEPKTIMLERVFKYGKVKYKNADRVKRDGF